MALVKSSSSAAASASVGQLGAWIDLSCNILDTLAEHSFRWKEADYQEFRRALVAVLEVLHGQPSVSSVLICSGVLTKTIEQYQRNAQRMIDGSVSELNDVVRILMSSAGKAHAEGTGVAEELQQIEETIRSARTVEEFQALKPRLVQTLGRLKDQTLDRGLSNSDLLACIQDRVSTLEQSSGAGVQLLQAAKTNTAVKVPVRPKERHEPDGLEATSALPARDADSGLDAATGLPDRAAAEAAISTMDAADLLNCYVAAIQLKRMESVQARFGEKLGNELLLFCAQQIAHLMIRPTDELFRWTGPGTFVACLKREGPLIAVRQEIGRTVSSERLTFEARNGAVLLPISMATHVMHASAHGYPALIEGLERFFSLGATQA